jgi:hypothetical protein
MRGKGDNILTGTQHVLKAALYVELTGEVRNLCIILVWMSKGQKNALGRHRQI